MNGGDIDKAALMDSFTRIKEDISRLNSEIFNLRSEQKRLLEENIELKKKLSSEKNNGLDKEVIGEIVKETIKKVQPARHHSSAFVKKINRNKKSIIKNRILLLAERKNMSVSEIKDLIVDEEGLCSKATFYRYVERMKSKGMIDFAKINDLQVIVRLD